MKKRHIIIIMQDAKRRACVGEITLAKLDEIRASMGQACKTKGYKLPKELTP